MAELSRDEARRLAPYVTHLNRPVFGLRLPQEVAGALFSRYSRSTKDLKRIFLDEFLGDPALGLQEILAGHSGEGVGAVPDTQEATALKKAREFYERVLVGYGDDSVAQLGGAHLACEEVSNVLAKILEDARIGISPLEKSTRYVRFDQRDARGAYPFHREARIMASSHAAEFLRVMDLLFDTYASQMEPMIAFVRERFPISAMELRHPQTGEPLSHEDGRRDARLAEQIERAYRSTCRAQACDILRGYLPAATTTNVGLFGVGQAFEYLLTRLYSHDLTEARAIAPLMHDGLNALIPAFVKRARPSDYLTEQRRAEAREAEAVVGDLPVGHVPAVTLVDFDPEAEDKLIAALLYPHARQPLAQLRGLVRDLTPEARRRIVEASLAPRRHRRDKPGRALEQSVYTFDLLGNLGMYRDLQRHRLLTQQRQAFTVEHGYDTPPEIVEAGYQDAFDRAMDEAARLYRRLAPALPAEAQYVVPFAYRIRWTMTVNLREMVHIAELRTMPQGHPDYRALCQAMVREIEAVHPLIARYARFVNRETYRLGRLASELRTEYKKSLLES